MHLPPWPKPLLDALVYHGWRPRCRYKGNVWFFVSPNARFRISHQPYPRHCMFWGWRIALRHLISHRWEWYWHEEWRTAYQALFANGTVLGGGF